MAGIADLAPDERRARILLSILSEPDDAITGRVLAREGGIETIRLLEGDGAVPGLNRVDAQVWRDRLALQHRLEDVAERMRGIEHSGVATVIPGDTHWPPALNDLGDRAPYVLWARGATSFLARPTADLVTVTGARAPGESAKTAQRRALQEMLDYATTHPVRYCIINKVDRLARNRLDDAKIHAALRDANISLVSVTENIDETPSGMLMHGILASMAEFYSLNLAQEVLKGMTQKAAIGGTPTKAPLGYLNVRTTDARGRESREIQVDPERADLVRFAFTAYATGDWSLSRLAKELTARGLTTRPTPSQPAKPVTTTGLHKILTNPYYQGTVTFRGVTYDGTHQPLVDAETWLRVQTNLDANNARGERPQKYDHYLKGTLYCACGAKLMIERPRDKTGDRYEYFTCSGRRRKTTNCTRSAILAERAEAEIERTYQRNSLNPAQAEHVRKVLNDVFDQLEGSSEDERKLLTAQRDKLEAERLKLVQAHYADAIPLDLLKSEQDRIRASLDQITTRLDNLTNTYAEARTGLDLSLVR